jgi:hypothetical protein
MTELTFADRVSATGLNPKPEDMAKLELLVVDLDRAATTVARTPRPYAEEPLSAFRLKKA